MYSRHHRGTRISLSRARAIVLQIKYKFFPLVSQKRVIRFSINDKTHKRQHRSRAKAGGHRYRHYEIISGNWITILFIKPRPCRVNAMVHIPYTHTHTYIYMQAEVCPRSFHVRARANAIKRSTPISSSPSPKKMPPRRLLARDVNRTEAGWEDG